MEDMRKKVKVEVDEEREATPAVKEELKVWEAPTTTLADVLKNYGEEWGSKGALDAATRLPFNPPFHVFNREEWGEVQVGASIPTPELFIPYLWDAEQLAISALAYHEKRGIVFTGLPATSKTTTCNFLAMLANHPVVRINGNPLMEPDQIIGAVQYEEGEGTKWKDGVLPVALREGYIVLHDEWERMPAFMALTEQSLHDDGQFIRLLGKHEDDIVVPKNTAWCFYTGDSKGVGDNIDKFSTSQIQDSSFLSRLKYHVETDYMSKTDEVESLGRQFDVDAKVLEKLVQLAGLCRTAYKKGEMSLVMSKRQLETICSDMPFIGQRTALKFTFYNSLPTDEMGVFEELYRDVYGSKW
jgi:hypothetical protein